MDYLSDLAIFDTNWNNLPIEIKVMIIKKLGRRCRRSLRLCSSHDQKVVDSVRFRAIYLLRLVNAGFKLRLSITKTAYSCEKNFEFSSFDELQAGLHEVMKDIDCIQRLEAYSEVFWDSTYIGNILRLSKNGKLVKVEELILNPLYLNTIDFLEQIDTVYLEKLEWKRHSLQTNFFNLPQVVNVGVIDGVGEFLEDEQLLKLECYEMNLEDAKKLTSTGLHKFIRKCILNLDHKPVSFQISYDEANVQPSRIIEGLGNFESTPSGSQKLLVNSPSSKFQLEIEHRPGNIRGKTIGVKKSENRVQSNTENHIRGIEYMDISRNRTKKSLTIREKNCAKVYYEFDSVDELQTKLSKELNEIDYIEEFILNDSSYDWNLLTSKSKRITIRKLVIDGDNSIEFLKQVESFNLEDIDFRGVTISESVNDMPQVVQAEKLKLSGCNIRDEQLLSLSAVWLDLSVLSSSHNLTNSGINMFLKKRLSTLDESEFHLEMNLSRKLGEFRQLFVGLDIFQDELERNGSGKIVLSSPFPDYQIMMTITIWQDQTSTICAHRIEKEI